MCPKTKGLTLLKPSNKKRDAVNPWAYSFNSVKARMIMPASPVIRMTAPTLPIIQSLRNTANARMTNAILLLKLPATAIRSLKEDERATAAIEIKLATIMRRIKMS